MLLFILKNLCLIFIINLIVIIHELGHYLFAKMFGVHVDMFCIGLGAPLFKYTDSYGTVWLLCAIPIGGYVSLLQDGTVKQKGVNDIHPLKNFLIVFAGPLFNFLLFCFGYFIVFCNLVYTYDNAIQNNMPFSVIHEEKKFLDQKLVQLNVVEYTPNLKDCCCLITIKIKNIVSKFYNFRLVGPIGIMQVMNKAVKKGILSTFYNIANLSLFLGICNLIPLYVLDGGVMLSYLYIYCAKRNLSERVSLILTYLSIILISFVLCYIMIHELFPIIQKVWSLK